jgi:regulator of RNase E activity RraA
VCPGDVAVGDADGVVVAPRANAEEVATFARQILDKDARTNLSEKVGHTLDGTVNKPR